MEPFIGQIIMFGGTFAPRGWALCDGQQLAIASNSALFSILGTTYGGDGETTFGLPDLRGRSPMHAGNGAGLSPRPLGQKGGVESVTLNPLQIPPHTHSAASTVATLTTPGDHIPARANDGESNFAPTSAADSTLAASGGGGGAHTNLHPFQCVNFIIALVGIYPSRS